MEGKTKRNDDYLIGFNIFVGGGMNYYMGKQGKEIYKWIISQHHKNGIFVCFKIVLWYGEIKEMVRLRIVVFIFFNGYLYIQLLLLLIICG